MKHYRFSYNAHRQSCVGAVVGEEKRLELGNSSYISYMQTTVQSPVSVVFFGGFMSDMRGTKAQHLFEYCKSHGVHCTVFDYFGHGSSSGEFQECTISDWYASCVSVVESLTSAPLVIVGSSMGGWLMLLTALSHGRRVRGLVGMAPAPDFTESLDLSESQRAEMMRTGKTVKNTDNCSYVITKKLIDDGKVHLLMNKREIAVECPMVLIHGMDDDVVPYQTSLAIAKKVKSRDVRVHLVKSGTHHLADEHSLGLMLKAVHDLM
ncbi:hydrolase [Anaplasma marginale str. Dawn]|uniref:alpha/beta hydrolase n=1 Tax=Anaplasma marginale TaxID=770 RepID=UPI0003C28835|nr:alpha/beta hydrolase [Anaplasma marginale]AGZ78596.1 hydrolase [Anaplasma marginale str. Gypsy Plains]AGZ79448.1 hydrolase [Anaplasma marginale str. Dawn]